MEVANKTVEPDLLDMTSSAPRAHDAFCLDTKILWSTVKAFALKAHSLDCFLAFSLHSVTLPCSEQEM